MVLKLDKWHRTLDYYQDCSHTDLGLPLTYGRLNMAKCLNINFMESLRNIQEDSNDDIGLTSSFCMAGQICYLGFYMGRVHGFCRFWCTSLKKNYICERKTCFTLEV